jgi:signal peptidase II
VAAHAVTGLAPAVSSRRWGLFAGLGIAVVLADQASKALVSASFPLGSSTSVVGDLVRIAPNANSGALFGFFPDQAWLFGVLSVGVLALIVGYHARSGAAGPIMSITLGLLLGGAVGNLIDRFRFGYVLDFVDIGIGHLRWYTFNVADAAISASILLLLVLAFVGERRP